MKEIKNSKERLVVLFSLLFLLIISYIGLVIYNNRSLKEYDNTFLPSTYIDDFDMSYYTYNNAEEKINYIKDYVLETKIKVNIDSKEYEYSLKDLGLSINIDKTLNSIKKNQKKLNYSTKLMMINGSRKGKYKFIYNIDENKLRDTLNNLKEQVDYNAVNGYFDTSSGVSYKEGTNGFALNIDNSINNIKNSITKSILEMNILLLSPIYPNIEPKTSSTPVVHYFAKEWINIGHNVLVINCPSNFPWYLRLPARMFGKYISSKTGGNIRTVCLKEREYTIDGVRVYRIPMFKSIPHGRYSSKTICETADKIISKCKKQGFSPDVIIGHWVNPSLELMNILKHQYKKPTCLVMHDAGHDFHSIYKDKYPQLLKQVDIWGYRSDAIKRKFESRFGEQCKWFYCFSGVPESFIPIITSPKAFNSIRSFIFVGTLIERKYPTAILQALLNSDSSQDFTLKYIGDGYESNRIRKIAKCNPNVRDKVSLLGRIPRNEISDHLLNTDVFVMISKNETFGLVYLEAMASGCITIASRDEGFDGIIKDGVNGFLCDAGDVEELGQIINRLRKMSPKELASISNNAIATANEMTDKLVAKKYIEDISRLLD